MSVSTPDIIDLLSGIEPGSHLDAIRFQRPQARENAQKSYLALFEPELPGDVSAEERYSVATFVAGLHREPGVLDFYASGLRRLKQSGIADAISTEIAAGAAQGPYGHYPQGSLAAENRDGPVYRVSEANKAVFGRRLSAALEHAHLLVFRPRDASPEALQELLNAGWSTTDIVTLAQLVSFLSFQIRLIVGLRTLAASSGREAAARGRVSTFTDALASAGH